MLMKPPISPSELQRVLNALPPERPNPFPHPADLNADQLIQRRAKPPSDSTFRLLLSQLDTLVCEGKTLRGSIDQTAFGAARYITQGSLYSNSLGVAIAQNTYATDACPAMASRSRRPVSTARVCAPAPRH